MRNSLPCKYIIMLLRRKYCKVNIGDNVDGCDYVLYGVNCAEIVDMNYVNFSLVSGKNHLTP